MQVPSHICTTVLIVYRVQMIEGASQHEDSAGHKGVIRTGGVQWMSAGKVSDFRYSGDAVLTSLIGSDSLRDSVACRGCQEPEWLAALGRPSQRVQNV